ncbi:hypothetical protein [Bacillus altitudinis]|uniref:hypothetical protein n=1 Tax=Bacillus altitudinis TaxID=293387 RepID=UPI002101C6FE|nr:hypothetical protein [Bacillus altitudinis]UTV31689.1 hypothetical protein NM966_12885 [Bacillus altitudinis]
MAGSKTLGIDDSSGFQFAKEMLNGDVTAAINFDRIQKNSDGEYIIFEYLLCDEGQMVNPYTSHPRRYWHKNKRKFISLCEVASDLEATLYLVNYAKKGTTHEDKILLMQVLEWDVDGVVTKDTRMTRSEFSEWFRDQNEACL